MTAHSLQSPDSFSLTVRVVTGNAKPKHNMTGPISKKHSGQRLELRRGGINRGEGSGAGKGHINGTGWKMDVTVRDREMAPKCLDLEAKVEREAARAVGSQFWT